MNDLISRIDHAVPLNLFGREVMMVSVSELENLPSAQQWIPVTERLPEEKVEVLVTVEVDGKKYIENGMLLEVNHGQWETVYDQYVIDVYGRNRNSKIIAWMPLPEPYEGGDAE